MPHDPAAPQSNLTADPLSHFMGRSGQIEAFESYLTNPAESQKVLVLSGVGGIGKTTLVRKLRANQRIVNPLPKVVLLA